MYHLSQHDFLLYIMKCDKCDLCIGSLNARGLNNARKRKSIFQWAMKNKFDVFFVQETYSNIDIESQWKNEWGGEIIFSHGTNHSKGSMIMFKPGFSGTFVSKKCDRNGRYVISEIEKDDVKFTLVNVYAPNKENEKKLFFHELSNVLTTLNISVENQLITGGDFNSIFNTDLDKSGGQKCRSNIINEMQMLIDELDLCDVWRIRNPGIKRFTYRQKTPLVQTRLDYFLISDHCQNIVLDVDVVPSVWSHHSGIVIKLGFIPPWPQGNNFWKFNASTLKDEMFVKTMATKIEEWKMLYQHIRDTRVRWELLKYEIRCFCIKYGKERKKCQNVYTGNLLQRLSQMEKTLGERPDEQNQQQYESIKTELQEIETEDAKGSIIRSKAKFIEEGEKPTRYFFNLEKRNAMKKNIKCLILPGGTKTTNPEEILEYQSSFYQTLYTSKKYNANEQKQYFLDCNIIPLSDMDKLKCEGLITKAECDAALTLFKVNKSPGNDGITVEFYRQFWSQLGDLMVECFNYCYEHGEMTVSQRQAIITLIEKYGKDKLYIKNWRPISLLNVDYKISSKVLALRVKKVLPQIIHNDQTGYVEGRQIFESIRVIQDIMEITNTQNIPAILLLIDFEKAFDSLEWDFLHEALSKFNFGQQFIKWVKLLYTNISSCIINNGTTTAYFPITRGARQGDPLSGYLFIIALELLSQKIRSDDQIHGIKIGEHEIKLTQYVDDMTVFVSDKPSAKRLFKILEMFKLASGLQMNIDKTEGVWLGRNKDKQETPFGIKWPKEPVKALGIYFSYDKHASERCNFVSKLEQLTRQLHWWKARDLTLLGKVLIIKTIGLSKFIYAASVLHVPENIIMDVNRELFNFLWNGKVDKVKRDIVIQEYEYGGLKMSTFDMCIKAAKVKWIQKYLDCSNSAQWKTTLEYLAKKQSLKMFVMSNFKLKELPKDLPMYYLDSFLNWKEVKSEVVEVKEDLNNQFVWYNKNIEVDKHTIYCERLFQCGLWNVNDLYNNGILVTYDEWQKRGAKTCDYMIWRGIVNAIPDEWKLLLKSDVSVPPIMQTCIIEYEKFHMDAHNVTEKDLKNLYRHQCLKKLKDADYKAKCKYNAKFNIHDDFDWQNIYGMPFATVVENKIIEFQYKILYRIVPTNNLLYKMGKVQSTACDFCQMYPESIEHLFFECMEVKNFWLKLIDNFNVYLNTHIVITCKEVLLIVNSHCEMINNCLNTLFLYGKKFIMICKLQKTLPTMKMFVTYMDDKINIVKQTHCKHMEKYNVCLDFINSVDL